MKYLGSKNRISKDIVPIIQSYIDNYDIKNYLEPFVGGANLIDKIKCENKYGSDVNKYLIALLSKIQVDSDITLHISEEEYNKVKANKENYDDWYIGLVGFCSTFSGKFFGGYARSNKKDGTPRDMSNEAIRNLIKQSKKLKDIKFNCCSYENINKEIEGFLIYCDPPYRDTTKYNQNDFNYEDFYDWCINMNKKNIVIISEYYMPEDKFKCIWNKDIKIMIDSNREQGDNRTEKLFIVKE